MADVAQSFATKQAEGLLGKLVSIISGEVSLLLGVRGEIQYIKDELEVMSAYLRRPEENQNIDPAAKAWVEQVKELAYALEDCIDEFGLHIPRRNSRNWAHALWRRARSLGSLRARRRIAANIISIKSRVEEVSKRRKRYGIDHKASSCASVDDVYAQYNSRPAALFVEHSQLVGINSPIDKLVQWLLDGQLLDNNQVLDDSKKRRLRLMAVVGSGGLGKTTIINRVVESPDVTGGHFDCRAWVTVSQVYRIEGLLRDLIIQICSPPPDNLEKMKRMMLIEKLKEHLQDKRYAIVFEDIWTLDAWKSLEDALPKNEKGSRIIVTTRKDDVAEACLARISGDKHEQRKLSDNESWDLFCKKVFPEQTCPEELETPSRSILKKCDGMPLAIVAIAAVLASKSKKTEKEWNDMLTHLSTELESNQNLRGVMRVMNLSYTDLPYPVKRCFLYLSKFPEYSLINCNRIKRLWIAEGLVSGHRDMTAEFVADSYLNVLINRCLILPLVFTVTGRLKSFTVHNVMMEMIVSKSMEENFVHVLNKDSKWLPHGLTRRLSTHTEQVPEDIDLSFVRSMTMFGDGTPSFLFASPAFNLLRVLDFDGCRGLRNEHLEVICGLLHLKYLSIRDAYNVYILPDSIGNLRNLETLDFRGYYKSKISPKILNLKKLRFLRGGKFELPGKIGKLRAIEELGTVVLKKGMAKDLQYLNQIKKLQVWMYDFEGKDGSDFCNFLEMESNSLRSLWVSTSMNSSLTFLKDLPSAPAKLEKLGLVGSLGTMPKWVSSLPYLHKISLLDTELGADAIQALGALSDLLQLDLGYGSYSEETLAFGAEGFRSLKVLSCSTMKTRSLIFEQGALPSVESVIMMDLEMDKKIEGITGLENLTCLKTVGIGGMFAEVEVAVKEAVKRHPNNPKLIIN